MNFHFNPSNPNRSNLIAQLEKIDRDLENDRKKLSQHNQERKKLQAEFYEDQGYEPQTQKQEYGYNHKNGKYDNQANYNNQAEGKKYQGRNNQKDNKNLDIADQIMNQLMAENKSRNYPRTRNSQQDKQFSQQYYQNVQNFNKNPSQKNQFSQPQHLQSVRPNNLINNQNMSKRQQQIQKLQNRPQQNPFYLQDQGKYSYSRDKSPYSMKKQNRYEEKYWQKPQQYVNQREMQKLKLQQAQGANLQDNPFWGNNRSVSANKQRVVSRQRETPQGYPYQNPRQVEKQKLQQKLYSQGQNNINRSVSPQNSPKYQQQPAQKDFSQQPVSKKIAYENRYSNPFAKDEQFLRQKRQQQQREYRRVLEQQKKIQQQRKKQQKKQVKQEKYAFNAYDPSKKSAKPPQQQEKQQQNNKKSEESQNEPILKNTKKIDPNGQRPKYNYEALKNDGNLSEADQMYMQMRANQLGQKYKKGRIHYDEYMAQITRLAGYYKVNVKDLMVKEAGQEDQELPWVDRKNKEEKDIRTKQAEVRKADENEIREGTERKQEGGKFKIVQNQQSLQQLPQSQSSLHSHRQISSNKSNNFHYNNQPNPTQPNAYYGYNLSSNPYQQNLSNTSSQPLNSTTAFLQQQFPQMDYQLMRRMFEELKAMRSDYTKSLENQKQFLQETFMKMMMGKFGQQASRRKHKQQKRGRGRQGDNQGYRGYQNIMEPSQSNLTQQSMDYIEKSLSGIVNKIPLNKNYEPSFVVNPTNTTNTKKTSPSLSKKPNNQTLQSFYLRPYKKKPFKKFSIMVDLTQSQRQIPNLSNFLSLKNGKQVLNRLFEEDLIVMRQMQRDKDVKRLRERGNGKKQEEYRREKSQRGQKQKKGQKYYEMYGDTFNENSMKKIHKTHSQQANPNQTKQAHQSHYQQYQNFSRHSQKLNHHQRSLQNSSHYQQNHRSYKKISPNKASQQSQQNSSSLNLQKHYSSKNDQKYQKDDEKLPSFSDQSDIKLRSPHQYYYSPKLSSEILEQDEYQTEQKDRQVGKVDRELEREFYNQGVEGYQMKKKGKYYEHERESDVKRRQEKQEFRKGRSPQGRTSKSRGGKSKSGKKSPSNNVKSPSKAQPNVNKPGSILNVIQSNNDALQKYQVSPRNLQMYSPSQPSIKQYSSINSNPPVQQIKHYFSSYQNNQNNHNPSQKSQQSYKSDKFNSQKIHQEGLEQYEESLQTVRSEEESVGGFVQSRNRLERKHEELRLATEESRQLQTQSRQLQSGDYRYSSHHAPSIGYSQTVESIQQSSSKLNKPPLHNSNKKRSTSRKKQSSLMRTKIQKQSILLKPPMSNQSQQQKNQNNGNLGQEQQQKPIKFDSHVYESQYDETLDPNMQKKIESLLKQQETFGGKSGEGMKNKSKRSNLGETIGNRMSEPEIHINEPVINTPKQSQRLIINNNQSKTSHNPSIGNMKLKSLQQARNLAKQSKRRSSQNNQQQNSNVKYQEKLSQLQSFLTKRDESLLSQYHHHSKRQVQQITKNKLKYSQNVQKDKTKSPDKKKSPVNKHIMNLLDDLENETYKDDFQSYREESQL